jgi:acyl-CoA thioester hydrolase
MHEAPSSGWIDGRAHFLPVRIYYEDTDFSGLVYHANYLRYFERGRSEFLRLAGVHHTQLLAQDTAIALLSMNMQFRAAARIDDALLVRTNYDALHGPRIVVSQSIMRGDTLIAEAAVEACCISLTGRAKRAPKLLVDAVGAYLDPTSSRF